MSKGSKQRPTNREVYSANYNRIFTYTSQDVTLATAEYLTNNPDHDLPTSRSALIEALEEAGYLPVKQTKVITGLQYK